MVSVDRHTVIQVLGSLMNKPELLNDTDKYVLEPSDFSQQLDKFVFSAIFNLYINGANQIHAIDVENYLKDNVIANNLIEKENGRIFLQDCESYSETQNFHYYYGRLKKFNFLRAMQLDGRKIDKIYCEDITNPDYERINKKFEESTVNDLLNILKGELSSYEHRFALNNIIEEGNPADLIEERLKEWKQTPEVGCHLQGDVFNTVTRGGRKGKLYLRSSNSGGGKSRGMVGDACYIAYPVRFDRQKRKWISTGKCEKILYIMTEQEKEEIDSMILAYLTGYNEDIFTYSTFDPDDPIIKAAVEIMKKYKDNFLYAKMADPSSSLVKNLFRRYNIQFRVENFFFDYIFSCPGMLNEYRDLKVREDVAIRLFTTTLKNLAVELNSFIMTATQLSNMDEDKGGFKDFRNIRGSRALVDLCDVACIMTRPTKEDLSYFNEFAKNFQIQPNSVVDIFKNRRGRWNNVRIWSFNDLGCCRREDIFITDANMKPLNNFTIVDFQDLETDEEVHELLELFNTGLVSETIYEELELDNVEIEEFSNLKEVFEEDARKFYSEKGFDELL